MVFSVWLWSIYPMYTYVANFFLYEMKKVPLHQISVQPSLIYSFFLSSSERTNKKERKKQTKIFDVGPRAVNNNEIRYLNASCIMEWKHHEQPSIQNIL